MSEDVSATMRVGITVILVAALVATVLNLMVMSNSLLSNGQTTLQSGIDSVSTQEFATYDNTKVSGTQVATALSLFQGRDVAIVIQTKAFATNCGAANAINYGAILCDDAKASSTSNMPTRWVIKTTGTGASATITGTTGSDGDGGLTGHAGKATITANSQSTFITSQSKTAYVVNYVDSNPTGAEALSRKDGSPFYVGQLHNTNGMVDTSYDIINTTELGNAAYLLSSARFSSTIIKDDTGSYIGIFFKQLN